MKALEYSDYHSLNIIETNKPKLAEGEVLIEMAACGICGSELESVKNESPRRPPPSIMGHEFCGSIIDPGNSKYVIGTKVISHSVVHCGNCSYCKRGDTHLCKNREVFGMHRQGAFAEFVAVPSRSLIPWPANLSANQAALTEPLANGVHMVNMTKHLDAENVVVLGAGPIGLMAFQTFAHMRSSETIVIEPNKYRRSMASQIGASRTFVNGDDAARIIEEISVHEGADIVIDTVGNGGSMKSALDLCRPGGAVVVIGLHDNASIALSYDIILPEKQILGTYAASIEDMKEAAALMATGVIETESWCKTFNLDEANIAFNRMLDPGPEDIKAVITAFGR